MVNSDNALAQRVISDDLILDAGQREIDEKAITIIGKRQPMAIDLREIIGTIRISSDLERIGDLGKNIAKRVVAVTDTRQTTFSLSRVADDRRTRFDAAEGRTRRLCNALVQQVNIVRERDDEIDALYTSLFRELLTYMMEDPRNISACTHLLFCAKNIERIGDHATNIAETVYYIVTGEQLPTERPKEDQTHTIIVDEA